MDRWNRFSLYSPKGKPAVWRGEVILAGLSTFPVQCVMCPQTPIKAQQRCHPGPLGPVWGGCCLGQGQEHTVARILLAQLQASILRASQSCSWL